MKTSGLLWMMAANRLLRRKRSHPDFVLKADGLWLQHCIMVLTFQFVNIAEVISSFFSSEGNRVGSLFEALVSGLVIRKDYAKIIWQIVFRFLRCKRLIYI